MSGGASGRPAAVMISSAGIKREAAAAGFDLCGIAPASDHVELRYLREWLDLGYAGGMEYLRKSADRRADVRHVLPSARSVISLGTIYNTGHPYSADTLDRDRAAPPRRPCSPRHPLRARGALTPQAALGEKAARGVRFRRESVDGHPDPS